MRQALHLSQHSSGQASTSLRCHGPLGLGVQPLPARAPAFPRPKRPLTTAALPLEALDHLAATAGPALDHVAATAGPALDHLHHLLSLAYEPIVLPCSTMNCGDVTHRSTLDPALRMEERGLNPWSLVLLAAAAAYLCAKPGVVVGAFDYYIAAPLQRATQQVYTKDDFVIGKKVGGGGFGTVYRALLRDPKKVRRPRRGGAALDRRGWVAGGTSNVGIGPNEEAVILKKATEFGEAEVWMNERIMRTDPTAAARFITAFSDGTGKVGEPLWLVWAYEGDYNLAELMQNKDFPYNLEAPIFGRPLNIPEGPERRALAVAAAMRQLLEGLEACHGAGIVHRDIKPQNAIMSDLDKRIKLIDFGAAADLRIGINYVPNMYLLDPRYSPPQQYIMTPQTPRAPPPPVAALLSPVLWHLNSPDRFDMWSAGIVLLQMALPPLRNDNALVAFKKALGDEHKWDLRAWRRAAEARRDRAWADGFATLDAFDGHGWDLACRLIQYEPSDRLSAAAALAHPWFGDTVVSQLASTVQSLGRAASLVTLSVDEEWVKDRIAMNGTKQSGGLTEAWLNEEITVDDGAPPPAQLPNGGATIAWWQQRQADFEQRRVRLESQWRQAQQTIKSGLHQRAPR